MPGNATHSENNGTSALKRRWRSRFRAWYRSALHAMGENLRAFRFPWQRTTEEKLLYSLGANAKGERGNWKYLPKLLTPGERSFVRLLEIAAGLALCYAAYVALAPHVARVPSDGGFAREAVAGSNTIGIISPLYPTPRGIERLLTEAFYLPLGDKAESKAVVPETASDNGAIRDFLRSLPQKEAALGTVARDAAGKNYYALVKEGNAWGDGNPVTADDVSYTIQMIETRATRSALEPLWRGATVKTDGDLVIVTLRQADTQWTGLASLRPVSKMTFARYEPKDLPLAAESVKPLGNAGWAFSGMQREVDDSITAYELKKTREDAGNVEGYSYVPYPGYVDALDAVRAGEADLTAVPLSTLGGDTDGLRVTPMPERVDEAIVVNGATKSLKAVADRKALLLGFAAYWRAQRGETADDNESDASWQAAWDAALDNEGLEKAAWQFGDVLKKETLVILVPRAVPNPAEWEKFVATANEAMATRFGARNAPKFQLDFADGASYAARYESGDYDVAVVRQAVSSPADLRAWWWGRGDNGLLYRDPLRDRALDKYQTDGADETLLPATIVAEWPGIVLRTDRFALVMDSRYGIDGTPTLANRADWKRLVWRNYSWVLR